MIDNDHLKLILKRGLVLIFVLVLFISNTNVVYAKESSEDVILEKGDSNYTYLNARFRELNTSTMTELEVPYSDDYFNRSSNIFYLDFARASMGMTLAAFRDGKDAGAKADDNIKSFFKQAGFKNFESYWYDKKPTESSIATAIASKKIGDYTVIALICSGSGYKNEWLSNFDVGKGLEHEGFSNAATICEERIEEYIKENNITGDKKLWVSGFSRASAVGNLFAGRMIESGEFSDVYGYFFATPNNTKNPIAYNNLFNIIGQNDPVAQMPLSTWGYGRNGIDLYEPAQESNSNYISGALLADDISLEICGESFRNNPDINRQLHVVFEYLSEIFPTVDEFCDVLQPQLISAYKKHDTSDLIVLLREALANVKDFDIEQQTSVNSLMEFLDNVIYKYVSGNAQQKDDGSWNEDIALKGNLVLEHIPTTYISWLFADIEPEDLFVQNLGTTRLVIEGNFNLEIWDESGLFQSVSKDGEDRAYVPGDGRSEDGDLLYLYAVNNNGSAVVNLPSDKEYIIKLDIVKDGSVSLFSNYYTYNDYSNDVSDIIIFQANKGDIITLSNFVGSSDIKIIDQDGETINALRQELSADTKSIIEKELLMNSSFSLTDLLIMSLTISGIPVVLLIVALVIYFLGRKKNKGRLGITICFGLVALDNVIGAILFNKFLSNIWYAQLVLYALAFIFMLLTALNIRKIIKVKNNDGN